MLGGIAFVYLPGRGKKGSHRCNSCSSRGTQPGMSRQGSGICSVPRADTATKARAAASSTATATGVAGKANVRCSRPVRSSTVIAATPCDTLVP